MVFLIPFVPAALCFPRPDTLRRRRVMRTSDLNDDDRREDYNGNSTYVDSNPQ